MSERLVFLPGYSHSEPHSEGHSVSSMLSRSLPLGRYLPPLPEGMARSWLASHIQPGSWVLDPFGASPRLVVEAARAGYRVLVTANNPISRALLEMSANPPLQAELQSVMAVLASAYKGEERLELHIKALYQTDCAQCGRVIQPEFYLWERNAATPYAKSYHCPHCGDSGERPATEKDHKNALRIAAGGLHRARALERIAPVDDPDRVHVEEALEVYLPRALYVLFTLINKLDGLPLPPERQKLLAALLLHACDQANTLWPYPTSRERPRQLTVPRRFRENNIWLALEQGIELWAKGEGTGAAPPVPLVVWPAQPPSDGGIGLFEGRLKDLELSGSQVEIAAVLAAVPRPNQAFWTLSALWAGWLWGHEAVKPFKSVLRRRRYDWAWHSTALTAAMQNLLPLLKPGVPCLGWIGEAEPGFITAALLSAERAGFELEGVALREGPNQVQTAWTPRTEAAPCEVVDEHQAASAARQAAQEHLRQAGQPTGFLPLHTAALATLARQHGFLIRPRQASPGGAEPSGPAEHYSQLQGLWKEVFSFRGGFVRYEGSDQALEVGQWWLREEGETELPLADRVEMACVRFLQKHPGCSLGEIEANLFESFPGLLTPSPELVETCLTSYAINDPAQPANFWLRPEDAPAQRRIDLEENRQRIQQLGDRLGFRVHVEQADKAETLPSSTTTSYLWQDKEGITRYAFFVIASAVIGPIVLAKDPAAKRILNGLGGAKRIIVLPGGRANLVACKLQANPYLRHKAETEWGFFKYRHLRQMMENPNLTPATFEQQLALDPLTYSAPQMRLL